MTMTMRYWLFTDDGELVPDVATFVPEVANAVRILKLSPGSENFKALEALHNHGHAVRATIALAGGNDASKDELMKAAEVIKKIVAAAKSADFIVTPDDGDIDVVTFKSMQ